MIFQIIQTNDYPVDFDLVYDAEFVSLLKQITLLFVIFRLATGKFKISFAMILAFVYYRIYIC